MSETIETPEGWQKIGHRLVRAYGHGLAVMAQDYTDGTWLAWIHGGVNSVFQGKWLPLADAVAWANAELGVPQPVELVETEFADGSVLIHDTEKKRWAVAYVSSDVWWVHSGAKSTGCYDLKEDAVDLARRYVRGDA